MRRRHTLPTALAAMAATSLLLTACGSDDGGGGDDEKIKGAGDASASSSSSPKESEEEAERPEIGFPSYAKNEFEGRETGDAEKDAVLADNAERINSIDDAIFNGATDTEALSFYSTGEALASAKEFIDGYVEENEKWAGVTRYFDRTVSFRDDGAAVVIYCSDESGSVISKNPETAKLPDEPGTDRAFVLYNTRLEKNGDGVWQTTNVISKRGAEQCTS
ncbi:hypothetical protein [Streptomyces sp. NPDC004134]|uniref:hypothetical protein n=1 Tax=Streptomyces sp. NPDC004134 TaxID=3364691 RepID=UPI0036ACC8AE